MSINHIVFASMLTLTTLGPAMAKAQDEPLADADRWDLPEGALIVDGPTGPELRIRGASVVVPTDDFESGTIQFSMWVSGQPSFVGVLFRVGDVDAEHVYLRPHSSDQWDAGQYQPILNNQSTWQLYPDGNASAVIPAGRWFRVRLEVDGERASVYVGDATEPALDIAKLESRSERGGIRFSAGFRGPGPDGVDAARIRDLVITPRASPVPMVATQEHPKPGFLYEWRITDPFVADSSYPHALPTSPGPWKTIDADPSGLVNISRKFSRDGDRRTVLAAVTLRAASERVVRFDLDFSDNVTVFLNGQTIYAGANGWESHHPLYLGALNKNDPSHSVFLPLRPGINELILKVSEQAFGWGFIARIDEAAGVEIDASGG